MSSAKVTGKTQAVLAPGAGDAFVQKQQPKPCIVILIHGVNDLAGVYDDLETGICVGLNERLDHLLTKQGKRSPAALNPATYTSPKDDDGKAPNPDAVYYRRLAVEGKYGGHSRSVVIPFYWGFREEENQIKKATAHGEWLDRFGNRLDKAGTKEGGVFGNATSTIQDMFGRGFSAKLGPVPMNPLFGTPDHPLFPGPGRRYMVLAAQRLAMLVKIIRSYEGADGKSGSNDTINVVGHSQGTLITLLANAMLKDEGHRPVDGFVMMSSPYSLMESSYERMEFNQAQQTTPARLKTLENIVKFIGATPHRVPSLADMADADKDSCIGGLRWRGGQCKTTIDGREVTFSERDNRGSVFLYFSPQDQTVGLSNVQGIGWQGIGKVVSYSTDYRKQPVTPVVAGKRLLGTVTGNDYFEVEAPALPALGSSFYQRVFSIRMRNKAHELIGKSPAYDYCLRYKFESTWEGSGIPFFERRVSKGDFAAGQSVHIAAPGLPVPFRADFTAGGVRDDKSASAGIAPVYAPDDPIDSSIAITNDGIIDAGQRTVTLPDSAGPLSGAYHNRGRAMSLAPQLEAQLTGLNDPSRNPYTAPENNEWAANWHRISAVVYRGGRSFLVTYQETPNQARRRRMSAKPGDLPPISFHSAIPASAIHSRRALAYDLAIGQACSIDDETFYAYLCRVADWRLDWKERDGNWRDSQVTATSDEPDAAVLKYYKNEPTPNKELIDSTSLYRSNKKPSPGGPLVGGGFLPKVTLDADYPSLIVWQTLGDRDQGRPLQSGPRGRK
ncbi:DUF3274 domain-containing protein [Pseudomonas aeruginosa]|nr:DUF3274 domain-containing protein [Pseudomonas aeruginosa]